MSQWRGSLYCVSNDDGLHVLRPEPAAEPARRIDASGPQTLPMPLRPLSDRQLADWFTAWKRAGYEFRHAG
jgi:hypothetical protein